MHFVSDTVSCATSTLRVHSRDISNYQHMQYLRSTPHYTSIISRYHRLLLLLLTRFVIGGERGLEGYW